MGELTVMCLPFKIRIATALIVALPLGWTTMAARAADSETKGISPALCGKGDVQEPGIQGDVPAGQTANYNCGVKLVGQLPRIGNVQGVGKCAYVRSRGMIAEDAAALSDTAPLVAGENFLVVRRIPLGPLLDLIATFLDTLEAEYDLFVTYKDGGSAFSLPAALLR